jgi:hypothetical protein
MLREREVWEVGKGGGEGAGLMKTREPAENAAPLKPCRDPVLFCSAFAAGKRLGFVSNGRVFAASFLFFCFAHPPHTTSLQATASHLTSTTPLYKATGYFIVVL